jgi:hypothetical protein
MTTCPRQRPPPKGPTLTHWWNALPDLDPGIVRQIDVVAAECADPHVIARVAVDAYRRWWDASLPAPSPDTIVAGLVAECVSLREELRRLKEAT